MLGCPKPEDPVDGKALDIFYSSWHPGKYKCNEGLVIKGKGQVCDGLKWSGSIPKCEQGKLSYYSQTKSRRKIYLCYSWTYCFSSLGIEIYFSLVCFLRSNHEKWQMFFVTKCFTRADMLEN